MILSPFTPLGNTFVLAADTVSPAPIQPTVTSGLGASQAQIINGSSQMVYISYGSTAAEASANAAIPGVGASRKCLAILPQSGAVYSLPVNSYLTGVTAAAGPANVYITLGEGA